MISGGFGPVHPFQVRGWAVDHDEPDRPVRVEVRLDGQTLGVVTADRPAEHGRGGRGFVLDSDRLIPTGELHRLAVLASSAGGQMVRLDYAPPPPPVLRYPLPASDASQRPVFILGAARSGTTALMHALVSGTRYIGPGEGHLLDLLPLLLIQVHQVYGERRPLWEGGIDTMITAVPQVFVMDAVRHGFVELARALFPSPYWLDKTPTPGMILGGPILKAVWPEARFVFLKRRAIENLLSRLRRFPDGEFERQCHGWAESMVNWEGVRDQLGAAAIEIEHLELARNPAGVAKALRDFLALTQAEENGIAHDLAKARPERTAERFASVHALEDLPWTSRQVATFREVCGPVMRRFGYAETEAYHLDPRDRGSVGAGSAA